MRYECVYNSVMGGLTVIEEDGFITGLCLNIEKEEGVCTNSNVLSDFLSEACAQLTEYFSGTRPTFDLPIAYPSGTPFQHSVWNALRDIPYGETRSYEDIARAIGNPKAVRAIGQANTRNPILLLVPCHRVINKNGTIGGFGCGVEVKRKLLQLEGINIK